MNFPLVFFWPFPFYLSLFVNNSGQKKKKACYESFAATSARVSTPSTFARCTKSGGHRRNGRASLRAGDALQRERTPPARAVVRAHTTGVHALFRRGVCARAGPCVQSRIFGHAPRKAWASSAISTASASARRSIAMLRIMAPPHWQRAYRTSLAAVRGRALLLHSRGRPRLRRATARAPAHARVRRRRTKRLSPVVLDHYPHAPGRVIADVSAQRL